MVPVVASISELPDAITYANDRPNCRWYVAKRAVALGAADQVPPEWGEGITAAVAAADLNAEQRDALAKKGIALKDGSFPIRNRTDLAKAVRALGRAKNRVAAKKHILKRARALHSTDLLPDSYKPLTSATVSNDEVGLWVAQVRDLITEAGFDPDEFEAGTDGFETDYLKYQDDPQGYVEELIAANHEPDDDDTDEDDTVEPETPAAPEAVAEPVQPVAVPLAASNTFTTGSQPYVNVYTSPTPAAAAEFNQDALIAALKAAVTEGVTEALTAAKKPPLVDDTTGDPLSPEDAALVPDDLAADAPVDTAPVDAAPVDVESAKQSLRDKFGSMHKPKKPKVAPVPVAASVEAMRERIAARTAS